MFQAFALLTSVLGTIEQDIHPYYKLFLMSSGLANPRSPSIAAPLVKNARKTATTSIEFFGKL